MDRPRRQLTLYGRPGCHLCEGMAQALLPLGPALGFSVRMQSIEGDEALERAYGHDIPVLVTEAGDLICQHRLDELALRRALARDH